jgi:vacuolar protein sorting-associated protein 45
MVHELLTITNNRVTLPPPPSQPSTPFSLNKSNKASPTTTKQKAIDREVVLCQDTDHFYKGSALLSFGDLAMSIKELVADFQRKSSMTKKLDTLDAMQRFVENYPEFRRQSGTVTKHVSVVTELSHIVNDRKLMQVSELEQEISINEDMNTHRNKIEALLADDKIMFEDVLRIIMIYALRYEGYENNGVSHFKYRLRERAAGNPVKERNVLLIDDLIHYAGANVRKSDLFGRTQSFFTRATQYIATGIKGVENIYSQHKPFLSEVLSSILTQRASTASYPCVARVSQPFASTYKLIIVYIVGGCTYEEAAFVDQLNKTTLQTRILLGGSCVHNSTSFLADIQSGYRDHTLFHEA